MKTVIRGVKIKIDPSPEQAKVMDAWRREARSLWNLLLGMQQAAYSGEKFRPELKWRDIWADVVRQSHVAAVETWKHGKRSKDGKERKAAGQGKEPIPPSEEHFRKIAGGLINGQEPRLFIWEADLQKIMARLKAHPLTTWIGDLPSHAAQQVCKDVIKAIKAMLSERKKRAAGQSDRDVGFPKFKKARYAEGSVYMVNTQTEFDMENGLVRLPKLKQPMRYRQERALEGKLQGGRIWREGEQWWLSCQFEVEAPAPLPKTGRECGLKITSGAVLTTTWDGSVLEQTPAVPVDRKLERRIKLAGRRLARREKGSKSYYEAAAQSARLHAIERNRRDDILHKESRRIVEEYDSITVHKLDVADLMTGKRRGTNGEQEKTPKRLLKYNRNAAMARTRGYISYKAIDGGRSYNETHTYFPEVQACAACGKPHAMPLDKRILKCECGAAIERRANAAINEFEQGRAIKEATDLL